MTRKEIHMTKMNKQNNTQVLVNFQSTENTEAMLIKVSFPKSLSAIQYQFHSNCVKYQTFNL